MTPYPSLEMDALGDVATAARLAASGQLGSVNKPQAVHACWSLLGTGLSYGLPDAAAPVLPQATGSAEAFNALADECDALKSGKKAALPWSTILQTVLTLLLTLLGNTPA